MIFSLSSMLLECLPFLQGSPIVTSCLFFLRMLLVLGSPGNLGDRPH